MEAAIDLITREEVLERVRALGVPLTDRTLKRWEARGIVPRAVRRRFRGATRATYPAAVVPLIEQAFRRQHPEWMRAGSPVLITKLLYHIEACMYSLFAIG